jgi:hypothetical protein
MPIASELGQTGHSITFSHADPLIGPRFRRGMSVDVGALVVDELLAQNVCVPAVLSELTQHVEVHPSQRERTTSVALDHVVEVQR